MTGRAQHCGLLLCAATFACAPHVNPRPAPFEATLLQLTPVQGPLTPEALRGHVVLVQFVATWCFPCLTGVQRLEELQTRYGPRGLSVVTVGMDLEGSQVLEPFAEHYALNFPLLLASDEVRRGVSPFGAITALPVTVVLDREGGLRSAFPGQVAPKTLEALLEEELGR